jgi:hypothetical protein
VSFHQSRQNSHGYTKNVDRTHQQHDRFFDRCAHCGCQATSYASYTRNACHPETSHIVEITVCGIFLKLIQHPSFALELASSSPLDVLEFYRKLVAAAKPAEIDLAPI